MKKMINFFLEDYSAFKRFKKMIVPVKLLELYSIFNELISSDDIALAVEIIMVESEITQSFNEKFLIQYKVIERLHYFWKFL